MTTTLTTTLIASPQQSSTTVQLRPRYEGSNICTWIGFKHVNYLVEEAVLEHFRNQGLAARMLYETHGVCVDLVSIDTRILHAFHMDDVATAEVVLTTKPGDPELGFSVKITVERDDAVVKAVTSKVKVLLRYDDRGLPTEPLPESLAPYQVSKISRPLPVTAVSSPASPFSAGRGSSGSDPVLAHLTAGRNAFAWRWRIPYFYCHFTERMQMSGFLRQMEEVVDLFLADRGISIKKLLDEQDWIPVVPHSSITLIDEVGMEEELYTVYTVENIFKDVTYTSRMDCFVLRDGELVQVATGLITHGYAVIENRRDWHLVNFDERMLAGLRGDR